MKRTYSLTEAIEMIEFFELTADLIRRKCTIDFISHTFVIRDPRDEKSYRGRTLEIALTNLKKGKAECTKIPV